MHYAQSPLLAVQQFGGTSGCMAVPSLSSWYDVSRAAWSLASLSFELPGHVAAQLKWNDVYKDILKSKSNFHCTAMTAILMLLQHPSVYFNIA